jgi:uncharacterized membrane protein YedE/YeeE
MIAIVAFLAGAVFGCGLLLSGMTNPANVMAFLDVTGHWRPALAFTMAAAVAIALPAYALTRHYGTSLRGHTIRTIDGTRLDSSLLLGGVIFGVGWGLSGICPGPGLILLSSRTLEAFVFVGGLVAGMFAAHAVRPKWITRREG